ncbi:hypothetical protein FRX31_014478 [Thalictrum thalictroides]|uniref:TF-B3 domain-containing protein n=1 Tax=Thalictrum thalictroides TaxID=46969 RepID=A0A7J6WEQ6_THATH|nr:hypothetical protein FRX31_014478 [Thalictrum thalictroides]
MEETQGTAEDAVDAVADKIASIIKEFQNLAVQDQLLEEKHRMLEHFIHFYMKAKGAHSSAQVLREEAKLPQQVGALEFNLEEAKKLFDEFSQWKLEIPPECVLTELFFKNLTKSDVGDTTSKSFAQLYVPKNLAEEYICPRLADQPQPIKTLVAKDLDEPGKTWTFYFLLNTKNVYVMTKDWQKYVKEKGLKEGSKIIFKSNPVGQFFLRCES